MKNFTKYLALTASIASVIILLLCPILGADCISSFIGGGIDITNIVIERPDVTYQFSLVEKFPIIAFALLVVASIFLMIYIKTDSFINLMKSAARFLKNYVRTTYTLIKESKVKYLFIIPTAISLYMGYTFPPHVDEAITHLYFVSPALWEAICLYPAPNNHIFYSILANITAYIPWLDLTFCIRIPSIIASLLTWILAYRFVRKYYSENVALFVVALGSMFVTSLEFGYMARGYALIMLFVVICIYSAFNIITEGNRRRDWCIFAVTSIFAAFTVPTFLYPFVTISTLIFVFNYKNIKTQVIYSIFIVIGILLLYAPLLVVSGLDSLIANRYVASIDRLHVIESVPGYIIGLFVYIFCSPRAIVLGVLALPVLYSCYRKDKKTLILWAVFFIVPAICIIAHAVLPFFRVFFYYSFIIAFLFAISFRDIIDKINTKILFITLLILQIPLAIHFHRQVKVLEYEAILARNLSEEILQDNKTYYIKRHLLSELYSVQLRFEIARRKYNSQVVVGKEANMDNLPQYDYCIVLGLEDETQNREKAQEALGIGYHTLYIYKKKE